MPQFRVVVDANVLVDAATFYLHHQGEDFPTVPPVRAGYPETFLGIMADQRIESYALYLSPHIIQATTLAILENIPDVDPDVVEAFIDEVAAIADRSGGGVFDPPRRVSECRDHEDNLILDLAVETNAHMIVTGDDDLLIMARETGTGAWRSVAILDPQRFCDRAADAHRRDLRELDRRSREYDQEAARRQGREEHSQLLRLQTGRLHDEPIRERDADSQAEREERDSEREL